MTSQPYVTTASVVALKRRLSDQDWAIVDDVQQMRLAAACDLQALAALRGEVQVRQFRRRLQRLFELGVLARLERRVGGERAGSSGWVYALGLAGQRLLDEGDGSSVRRPWNPRPSWLGHALAASHLYVELRQAEHAGQLKLLAYQSEPACWRVFADGPSSVTLKPDAFVRFEVGDDIVSSFIEVDCATESATTLNGKFDVYRRHWHSDDEQTRHGVYPEVLWLAPTPARCRVLEQVRARQPSDAQALHRVGLYQRARSLLTEPPP
jgi:hypothetical protein